MRIVASLEAGEEQRRHVQVPLDEGRQVMHVTCCHDGGCLRGSWMQGPLMVVDPESCTVDTRVVDTFAQELVARWSQSADVCQMHKACTAC